MEIQYMLQVVWAPRFGNAFTSPRCLLQEGAVSGWGWTWII